MSDHWIRYDLPGRDRVSAVRRIVVPSGAPRPAYTIPPCAQEITRVETSRIRWWLRRLLKWWKG